ncbi:hypothetical protein AAVH_06731 [Aphelenchoides avenae]|nr:hypothetical protein AAVH_06731 [Aphelenchus avenae]
MSQCSGMHKRPSGSKRSEPVKRRRMLSKEGQTLKAKEAFCPPTETALDVFSALDRSALETLQLVCRRYRHLIESRLADFCHREILRASIALESKKPGRGNRWKSERSVCKVELISVDSTCEFNDSATHCLGRFARFLRHSVVTLQLNIDSVDGAHAFELTKHLAKNCERTRIAGQLRLHNLKSLAHFRCESVLGAFTDVGSLDMSFDERHYTNCDSLLRACTHRNLYNVQFAQCVSGDFGAIRPAFSEEAVIGYCLGREGRSRRVLRVPGHAFSKRFFAKLVHKALDCTEKHEVRLVASNITPQVFGAYEQYERETSDGYTFEFPEAPMPFTVLFNWRSEDVDLVFVR